MNLFVVGWNVPPEVASHAASVMRGMSAVYPELDGGSFFEFRSEPVTILCLHPSESFIAPRRYVVDDERGGCLFDGAAVDATGRVAAHDAAAFRGSWSELSARLEGQFTIVRWERAPATLDVMTDPFGMKQLYVRRIDGGWLMSNSVHALHRVRSDCALDVTAASLLLTTGWLPGHRTLRQGIHVMSGGQLWRWRPGAPDPCRTAYYPRARLQSPGRRDTRTTGRALIEMCKRLSSTFEEIECPLTAGRDSRLMAALLTSGHVPATYYTDGMAGSTDVDVAVQLARVAGLSHTLISKKPDVVVERWDELSRRILDQADGMASLWQIADVLEPNPIDRLRLRLWGAGGEIARGNYYEPRLLMGRPSAEDVIAALDRDLVRRRGRLVRQTAKEVARRFQRAFVCDVIEEGFSPLDALDLFYIEHATRRWYGSNARKAESVHDLFTPFCTRPFVEAAFAVPARDRYTEPLHRDLIRFLAPQLDRVAYGNGPWRSRSPALIALRDRVSWLRPKRPPKRRAFDRVSWIESRRTWIRSVCLDRATSPLWSVVDRPRFEAVTGAATTPQERAFYEKDLCHVLTVFLYEGTGAPPS